MRPDHAVAVIVGIAGAALVLAACRTTPAPPVPDPPPVAVTVAAPCLERPPPAYPSITYSGPEHGCPQAFEACLELESAARLEEYLRRVQSWGRFAWAKCGEAPSSPDAGSPE